MTDYGHAIEFGAFITPANNPPETAVRLARLTESAGFDLVTFQDHPYQPAFLDTWTLMTWVAAQTQRIHISANVLNLPLRPPAVMARAAASLDLLSNGRFDLALGAGAFWDAVDAMGGRKLTAGQAVDALGEAIDVIRGIWDSGNRAPLRVNGEYYRLDGAKRGPAPAHDIPIWIGAYKPRMQRLLAQKGDGWLPSLPWMKPGDLARGNALIDEAAQEAGRDPREVRRLLNISPGMSVDELAELAIDDGVSVFILSSDDPATLQQFGEEVAPAVRDAVAAERAGRDRAVGRVRSANARALRREGIDYDGLPASLAEGAIEPGDAKYARVRNTYLRGGSPGLVLQVRSPGEVADALAFARKQKVPLGIRSGGHGISGRSTNDGGIVIDLSRMNAIEILDPATRRFRADAGARWVDVAAVLEPHGWALTSGDYGGVGVGGLATAGGVGWFAREQGLTIDHLRRVHMVLADGSEVDASETENPELFWAIRGAGANFGIATSFEFEAHHGGDVGYAQFAFEASDTAAFLSAWGAAIESAPREVTGELILGGRRQGQPQVAQALIVVHSDDADRIIELLEPIAGIAPLLGQSVELKPYSAVMANVQDGYHNGQGEPSARSGLVLHLSDVAGAVAGILEDGLSYFFSIRAVGGAVSDVAPDATAYVGRAANFSLAAFGTGPRFDERWDAELVPRFVGTYLSFESDTRPERLVEAFGVEGLQRLRALKQVWDPENVFHDNFGVGE
jgi:alkanesulfonate monooxygenase SsuD/methylene tetrahydromethanopterin reductase-like flavin-dependent oxidoreductase (luciferase family)